MADDLIVNGKPAVEINAVMGYQNEEYILFNCEGKYCWLPKNRVQYNEKESTLLIEEWFYKRRVREGAL